MFWVRESVTFMQIATSSDVTEGEWDAFVASRPDATGYHQWCWRRVMEKGLGHRCRYLAAREDGRLVGVLPMAEIRRPFFGSALSSLPYVNYGGVLAASPAAADALIEHARTAVAREGLSYLVLRHRRRLFSDLPVRSHKQTMLLTLAESAEAMWTGLDRKVRNQIRKAEKSGLTVVAGGEELLDGFYDVFARNMRDLGTPVYGRELFAEMLRACPGAVRIHAVQLKGATIAAGLSYRYREVIEVPSASSLREHRSLCPNHIMYWHIIQSSIAEGARTLDFGRSTPGDGTYQFKEQWGAVPEQLEWEYVLGRGQRLPTADRHDSRFNVAIEAWKRLPLGVANMIGPSIVRAVP
jgi:FemAB-related protein (PEP-CTERM system-associated)